MSTRADMVGRIKAPVHLWIVGGLALLWNLMGAFDYLATQLRLDFYMSQFSPEQLEYFYSFPAWAVSGWAIAVWSALAGSIALLLRRRWAQWAFGISLAGMAVSSLYTYGLSEGASLMGSASVVFFLIVVVISVGLLVYTLWLARRGVLS
jgi:hypothetical protein